MNRMHTEHLQNVSVVRVIVGWLVSVAVASLVLFALVAIGIVPPDATGTGGVGGLLALAVGFGAGGYVTGFGALRAPILHGVAIGLTSLVAAIGLSVLSAALFPGASWSALPPFLMSALLFTQVAAAVLGALLGG
jgi:hypothetical protein